MVRSYLVAGARSTAPMGWLGTPPGTLEPAVPRSAHRVRALEPAALALGLGDPAPVGEPIDDDPDETPGAQDLGPAFGGPVAGHDRLRTPTGEPDRTTLELGLGDVARGLLSELGNAQFRAVVRQISGSSRSL